MAEHPALSLSARLSGIDDSSCDVGYLPGVDGGDHAGSDIGGQDADVGVGVRGRGSKRAGAGAVVQDIGFLGRNRVGGVGKVEEPSAAVGAHAAYAFGVGG